MDNREALRLVKGKCAGKNGVCPATDLVIDGLCTECAAIEIDTAISQTQAQFAELKGRWPDLAKSDKGVITQQPFADFVKGLSSMHSLANEGAYVGLANQAHRVRARMVVWEANELSRLVGKSSIEGTALARDGQHYLGADRLDEAIESAQRATTILEPFHQIRIKLNQLRAARSQASATVSSKNGDNTTKEETSQAS